jgi:PAS domain S-box-containing protein
MVIGTIAFLAAVIHRAARDTQRAEADQARIHEERDRFFDVSLDMLVTADSRGYFVRLNPAWTTVLGYDLDELTARPFVDFVHPDDREATNIEAARQIERGQTVLNFQNRYRHRDGSYRWLEWVSTPSADGQWLYAMARDITDRRLEEERLAALVAPARALEARRLAARSRIQGIIASQSFAPVFQPVVDLASRRMVGFEGLTRFADGGRPAETFAEAVDCGLGLELEVATLRAVIGDASHLPKRTWLSLNVSPGLIEREGILEGVLDEARRAIVLEITEHEAVAEYAALRGAVARLGPRVRIAVDDTGAGVANFNHLAELRPSFLKIDIGLVRGVEHDVGRQAVVAGLVHFAASTGGQVIAEGIETTAEETAVADLGVTLGQGFGLARPKPAAAWASASRREAPIEPIRPPAPPTWLASRRR